MPADREPAAQPARAPAEKASSGAVAGRSDDATRAGPRRAATARPGRRSARGWPAQRMRPGGHPAGQPLQRAEVEERPADERRRSRRSACATSISSRRVRICSRMVLKVTATSANANSAASIATASRAELQARFQALRPCRVELHVRDFRASRLTSARSASSACGAASRGSTMNASGSGFCARLSTTSARPVAAPSGPRAPGPAARSGMRARRVLLQTRLDLARRRARPASSARNSESCGSGASARAAPADWRARRRGRPAARARSRSRRC